MGINQRTLIIRIIKTSLGITFVIAIYFLVRIFVCDIFPVSTQSMYPTIKPGERIVVNKLIFGARIYKNLKFINENTFQVWRMPGMREIRNNDIVVFNYPFGGNAIHGINFKIEGENLECTATDSYRLAVKKIKLENKAKENSNIIIPTKNLNELIKLMNSDEENIEMHIFANKVV